MKADQNVSSTVMMRHEEEVAAGERFEFGANWARFLRVLDDDRIRAAEKSLQDMLGVRSLVGMSFIDVGCGSGLFSLAARRLGARVLSFDYDPKSVGCARELRERYFQRDPNWDIQEGSVLDPSYLAKLGQFDIVCSWGVLHHTGDMWRALANVRPLVKLNGLLFIAIYNDQGKVSERWLKVKKLYNRMPRRLRFLLVWATVVQSWWRDSVKDLLKGRPFYSWRERKKDRGMSPWWDAVDWVGGYPFEVATPEKIVDFYRRYGFHKEELKRDDSLGCNQFVFRLLDEEKAKTAC